MRVRVAARLFDVKSRIFGDRGARRLHFGQHVAECLRKLVRRDRFHAPGRGCGFYKRGGGLQVTARNQCLYRVCSGRRRRHRACFAFRLFGNGVHMLHKTMQRDGELIARDRLFAVILRLFGFIRCADRERRRSVALHNPRLKQGVHAWSRPMLRRNVGECRGLRERGSRRRAKRDSGEKDGVLHAKQYTRFPSNRRRGGIEAGTLLPAQCITLCCR